jgi:hypothetical protein
VAAGIKRRQSVLHSLVLPSADPTISMTTDVVNNSVSNEGDADRVTLEHDFVEIGPSNGADAQRFHQKDELLGDDVMSNDSSASAANVHRQHEDEHPEWYSADDRQGDINDVTTMRCSSILTPYSDTSLYNGDGGVLREHKSIFTGFSDGRSTKKMRCRDNGGESRIRMETRDELRPVDVVCRERQPQVDVNCRDVAVCENSDSERRTKGLFDSNVTTTHESVCCNDLDDVINDRPLVDLDCRSATVVGEEYSDDTSLPTDRCHRGSDDAVGGARAKRELPSISTNKRDIPFKQSFGARTKDGARISSIPRSRKSLINGERRTEVHSPNNVEIVTVETSTNNDRNSRISRSRYPLPEMIKSPNVIPNVSDDGEPAVCGCCGKLVRPPSGSSDIEAPAASRLSVTGTADDGGDGNDDNNAEDGDVYDQRFLTSPRDDNCSRSVLRRTDTDVVDQNKRREVGSRTSPRSNRSQSAPPSTGLFSPLWSYLFKAASTTSVTSPSDSRDGRRHGSTTSPIIGSTPSTWVSGGSLASTTFLWSPWLRPDSNRLNACRRHLPTPSDSSCQPKPEVCLHLLTLFVETSVYRPQ